MAWFEHGASRIYYEEQGSGEALLLLPGWSGSIDELAPLREALAPNFQVIAADLPGSGKSGPQPRAYAATYFEDDARSLLALLEDRAASPAHLVGFSDGGEEALLMAAVEPRKARSVVAWGAVGQIAAPPAMLEAFHDVIDSPIESLAAFSEYLKGAYGEANARAMAHSWTAALRAIIDAGGDICRSMAGAISCPALLITGEHDFFAPPALVTELADAIPAGEFLEAKGAGHAVHREQPEWLTTTVAGWLAKPR